MENGNTFLIHGETRRGAENSTREKHCADRRRLTLVYLPADAAASCAFRYLRK